MIEFIKAYMAWRKEHRDDVLKVKMAKAALKQPLNYELIENFFKAFTDTNSDLVCEIEGNGFKLRIFRDVEGKIREERMDLDDAILGHR